MPEPHAAHSGRQLILTFGNTKLTIQFHHLMKYIIPLLLLTFTAFSIAQSDQQQPVQTQRKRVATGNGEVISLKANYLVTLSSKEKDKAPYILSFIVATNRFNASTGDTLLTFAGELTEDSEASLLAVYSLSVKATIETTSETTPPGTPTMRNIQYVDSGVQSSTIMSLDKPFRIFTSGNREYTLQISKVEEKK